MTDHAFDMLDLAPPWARASMRGSGIAVHGVARRAGGHDQDQYADYELGPLRVRAPAEAWLRMADTDDPYSDAVFFDFPDGAGTPSHRSAVLACDRLRLPARTHPRPTTPPARDRVVGRRVGRGGTE
jgi:hypothetical protein